MTTSASSEWAGKRVLVTGSGRGIGKGIAKAFAAGGAYVLLVARTPAELDATRAEFAALPGRTESFAADLLEPDASARAVAEAVRLFGGLDIVVTNAGAAAQGGFLELPDDAWPTGFGLKMFANLRVIKAAWPHLKASNGSVVMIGGGTARMPERHLALVSAVNGGQAALSKAVAEQGLIDGVQVNLVQPGTIRTIRREKLFAKLAAEQGVTPKAYAEQFAARLKIPRLGDPADVANAVTFLCRPESRWIHGAVIDVDGGQNKSV
ncbi:MAG: SDR family oxidoreductase [Gemmataceae bacterium]|nr:SDR family oxidoreductase [Gemmataceae bacterium]